MERFWHGRSRSPSQPLRDAISPSLDLLVYTRAELMEVTVASRLKVLRTMLEEDRTAICGRVKQNVKRWRGGAGRDDGIPRA